MVLGAEPHYTILVHLSVKGLTAMANVFFSLKPMVMKEHLIKFCFITYPR